MPARINPLIRVDLIADLVCPWCAIGYLRLRRAMDQLKHELRFDLHWQPFQLAPQATGIDTPSPESGGSADDDETAAAQAHRVEIASRARALGLSISAGQRYRVYNTFDAHRLMAWAEAAGLQSDLAMALYRAFFELHEDLAERNTLIRVAGQAGLDEGEARAVLESERFADRVRGAGDEHRNAGIDTAPTFLLNQTRRLSGPQDIVVFLQTFSELAQADSRSRLADAG